MATEAQRARRRRNRQRRTSGGASTNRRGLASGQGNTRSNRPSAANPSTWFTEVHSFAISGLTGPKTDKVWCIRLEDVNILKGKLNTAGEYRLLSLRCTYNPITAQSNDRVGIAPYFDPINKLMKVHNFPPNGRPLRKGDARFSEVWNVPSEITTVVDVARPLALIGGVCVYFHKDGAPGTANVDGFIINCDVTYQVRGKKADVNVLPAT